MKKLDLKIFIEEYTVNELPEADKDLFSKAKQACEQAYAPYSNFYVGAAILLENGTIVLGNNQENAAYPSGMCAERTAIYATGANHRGQKIIAIAVAACKGTDYTFIPVAPCGACRQAMLEYESKQDQLIRLILQSGDNACYIIPSISTLLPLQFTRKNLLG
ncbi:cytidine deaminase [Rhodocytophaga rosea]|uniref:Cytidine deaminase n=1 Tax=Rhodocytophaga rosea TaxID=2704465 RepID=A0A6C0GMW4_9BACT|nr:cytidine deaminase [Rhodocytophaga rosea]QHT69365.1 cytidine deaminase [Rhodocytophaga rosea]